jgi:hypothetical protein
MIAAVSVPPRFRINDELTAAKVFEDEAIVINVVTGRYYDLEGSGALAWTMLAAGASADEVAAAFTQHFEVDAETARRDVGELAERLVAEELVVDAPDASPTPAPEPPAAGRAPYEPPALATYTDMEDLLTVDPPLPAAYTPRP